MKKQNKITKLNKFLALAFSLSFSSMDSFHFLKGVQLWQERYHGWTLIDFEEEELNILNKIDIEQLHEIKEKYG
jgi:hypothetical protein